MPDISKINIEGIEYDIKDVIGRNNASDMMELIENVSGGVTAKYETYLGDGTSITKTFNAKGKPLALYISQEGGTTDYLQVFRGCSNGLVAATNTAISSTWSDNEVTVALTSSRGNASGKTYNAVIFYEKRLFDGQVQITVLSSDGNPIQNVRVEKLYTQTGGTVVTNENGVATGYGVNGDTITVDVGQYIDIERTNTTLSGLNDKDIINLNITMSNIDTSTIIQYTTSKTIKLAKTMTANIGLVGGGSGGEGGHGSTSSGNSVPRGEGGSGGNGGAGGKILNITNLSLNSNILYSLTIGTGGSGATGGPDQEYDNGESTAPTSSGKVGGNTTFSSYSSANGSNSNTLFDSSIIVGGSGGKGADGASSTGTLYKLAGSAGTRAGGSGGQGTQFSETDLGKTSSYAGGAGSSGGIGGGGGGGGGASSGQYQTRRSQGGNGGKGGNGAVYIQLLS